MCLAILTLVLLITATGLEFHRTEAACCNPCPFNWISFGGHCYRLFFEELTWYDAEDYCQWSSKLRVASPHLVSITGEEENQFVVGLIQASQQVSQVYWLGFNDIAVEGTFVWSDASPSVGTYTNWQSNQPDNIGSNGDVNCAILANYYDWEWDDRGCSAPAAFVCKGGQFVKK